MQGSGLNKAPVRKNLNNEEARDLLEEGASAMGISLSPQQTQQFMDYLILLQKWNRAINLTALHQGKEIIVKHFLDSLTVLPYLPEEFRLLDLGSGPGFPGLPIRIMRPHQEIVLMEASAKKVSFLKEVIRRLGLDKTQVLQVFLKKGSPLPHTLKNPFNVVTTRAVGKLPEILAGVKNLLAFGGKLILMKGRKGLEEMASMEYLIDKLGFQMEKPIFLTLPLLNQERTLIILTRIGSND